MKVTKNLRFWTKFGEFYAVYRLVSFRFQEIQDMTERAQFSARQKLVDQQMLAKEELLKKHRDSIVRCQSRQQSSTLQMVLDSNEKELKV